MKQVLIAADAAELAESIQDALGSKYYVEIAISGLQAIELYKQKRKAHQFYDALILDIDFSVGISGLDVANWVRRQDKEIQILVFGTYLDSADIRRKVLEIGAEFREKPLEPVDLRNFVQGNTNFSIGTTLSQ